MLPRALTLAAVALALAGCVSPEPPSGPGSVDARVEEAEFRDPEAPHLGSRITWCGFCMGGGLETAPENEAVLVYENGRTAHVRFNFDSADSGGERVVLAPGVEFDREAIAAGLAPPTRASAGTYSVHEVRTFRLLDEGRSMQAILEASWDPPVGQEPDCEDCAPTTYVRGAPPDQERADLYRVPADSEFSDVTAAFRTLSIQIREPPRAPPRE